MSFDCSRGLAQITQLIFESYLFWSRKLRDGIQIRKITTFEMNISYIFVLQNKLRGKVVFFRL